VVEAEQLRKENYNKGAREREMPPPSGAAAPAAEDESLAARRTRLLREEANARRRDGRCMTRVGADWGDLPSEILLKIFSMVAESDASDSSSSSASPRARRRIVSRAWAPREVMGALPLVPRVTRVCKGWRDAVKADPAPLWRYTDISYG
jgi:hypothetical protein